MITRKLLIVHQSKVVRKLLKGYVLAELDDVTPLEAKSGQEVDDILNKEQVHVVLCALYLRDCEGFDIFRKMKSSRLTAKIPFILFTSTGGENQIKEIEEQNIENYLIAPFSATELRDAINQAFNPRKLRQQQRYNIPGTKAFLHLKNNEIESEVINLSLSSVFCEFILPKQKENVLNNATLSLKFPFDLDDIQINEIYCRLLSIKTMDWNSKDAPEKVRAVWLFKDLPDGKANIYAAILQRVEERNQKLAEMN